jgi:hypothetical protein
MSRIGSYSLDYICKLRHCVKTDLDGYSSLLVASQKFASIVYDELDGSVVFLHVFATVPVSSFPERERKFTLDIALARGCSDEVHNKTTVVTLLGTRGRHSEWNDRYLSGQHLAIPLTSTSFIKTLPMVSRLMSDMGTEFEWVQQQRMNMMVKTIGRMTRVLYVEDTATARTDDGFQVVPEADFVRDDGVWTVLGLGEAYLNRTIVAILLFTNELIPQDRVERFMPIVYGFKVATMNAVMKRRISCLDRGQVNAPPVRIGDVSEDRGEET